ncbi:MFS transporter [Sphingomonas lenta]|uniref:MFS transporter n=1 Tax=Sphingomonas lenta TaxID=1141887 RepID=A0A2A2SET8_9SPHN|nr:MFS transporter [Sphingomonas lenta]PAX07692.1 MFS transporter [Sphingomonas lenta]
MDPRPRRAAEPGDRFLLLFALANAGGVVAYAPFLTLLLPVKLAAIAGEARIEWLGAATLAGAGAASLSNLLVGWASDVVGTRRAWAAAGLCLTLASYALLHAAASPLEIVAAVAAYQLALNALLAPLAAWAADEVPDRRKGLLGGLLGAGPPAGALAGVAATLPGLPTEAARLGVVCAIVFALTAPLLLLRTPAYPDQPLAEPAPRRTAARRDFALLWLARLLVQVAGNVMFGFLLYYFQTLPDAPSEAGVARLSALALALAFPIALAAGRISDRLGPRKPFLLAAAAATALGLALMAASATQLPAAIGYALFGCGGAVFLALHSGYAMQLLPTPGRRGRDLGLLNLANTLPAIVAPLLAISLVPGRGFGPLLALLAALIVVAGACVALVRRDAPRRLK